MAVTIVMLPPASSAVRRWAEQLRARFADLDVVVCETAEEALERLPGADAAYGTLPEGWDAPRLRWLQAPMAAPPFGYFTPQLAAHPVTVTNMRGIYNDHIATHVMAFLLAFAGIKLILSETPVGKLPIWLSLSVIIGALAVSIIWSLWTTRKDGPGPGAPVAG